MGSYDITKDDFYSLVLGLVYGLQYNKRVPGTCYETIELNMILIDEMLSLLTNLGDI